MKLLKLNVSAASNPPGKRIMICSRIQKIGSSITKYRNGNSSKLSIRVNLSRGIGGMVRRHWWSEKTTTSMVPSNHRPKVGSKRIIATLRLGRTEIPLKSLSRAAQVITGLTLGRAVRAEIRLTTNCRTWRSLTPSWARKWTKSTCELSSTSCHRVASKPVWLAWRLTLPIRCGSPRFRICGRGSTEIAMLRPWRFRTR